MGGVGAQLFKILTLIRRSFFLSIGTEFQYNVTTSFKQYFSLSIQSIIRPILPRKSIIYIFFISSIFTSCVKSTTSYLFGPIRKLFPWKKGCLSPLSPSRNLSTVPKLHFTQSPTQCSG